MIEQNRETSRESGMALLPTIILLVIIAIFLLVFLEGQYNDSHAIGNNITHHLESLALDQGAEKASNQLNSYVNWPEVLTAGNSSALAPEYIALPATQNPTQPVWTSCVANNKCEPYTVKENGITLSGAYVIYPAHGLSEELPGYEESKGVGPTSRKYVAYVEVTNNEGSQVVKEFVLRKVMP